MKIDVSGGYNIVRKNVSGDKLSKSASADSGKKAASADVVEISRGNTAIADKSLLTLKSSLQRDVSQPATAERMEQLRSSVKNGTYRIPTEDLVDSMIEF